MDLCRTFLQSGKTQAQMYLGLVDYSSSAFDETRAMSLLDEAELERLARMGPSGAESPHRQSARPAPTGQGSGGRPPRGAALARRAFLAGRLLAKETAASALGLGPEDIRIATQPGGKPSLALARGADTDKSRVKKECAALIDSLGLGIAHSRGLALCAIGPGSIGLDIEYMESGRDRAGIARRFFLPQEADDIAGLDGLESFYARWTLKEAWLKMRGWGLERLRLAPAFVSDCDGRLIAQPAAAQNEDEESDFHIFFLEGERRYAAAIFSGRL